MHIQDSLNLFGENVPLSSNRIQLHVHLDGSYRMDTLYELAKASDHPTFRGCHNPGDMAKVIQPKNPSNLKEFLNCFVKYFPLVAGNQEAIYRTTYEFVEDCAANSICYVETRFCPHYLASNVDNSLDAERVLQITLKAIHDACKDLQNRIVVRVILTIMRTMNSISEELLKLSVKYREQGVIGIDAAGDERYSLENGGIHVDIINAFRKAKFLGIHRTVHAGENGTSDSVREAFNELFAERIGHGYRILDDPKLYELCLKNNYHFETCPCSSYLTGSFVGDWTNHPLVQFLRDGLSCSVSVDDSLLTGKSLNEEYDFCRKCIGLSDEELALMNMYAAKASFLPERDRIQLLLHLERSYGIKFHQLKAKVLNDKRNLTDTGTKADQR